jgi:hypothetical protein
METVTNGALVMAMTNSERQAKWRASLKQKAAIGLTLEDALRKCIGEGFPEDIRAWTYEDDKPEHVEAAKAAILSLDKAELEKWFKERLLALFDDQMLKVTDRR